MHLPEAGEEMRGANDLVGITSPDTPFMIRPAVRHLACKRSFLAYLRDSEAQWKLLMLNYWPDTRRDQTGEDWDRRVGPYRPRHGNDESATLTTSTSISLLTSPNLWLSMHLPTVNMNSICSKRNYKNDSTQWTRKALTSR